MSPRMDPGVAEVIGAHPERCCLVLSDVGPRVFLHAIERDAHDGLVNAIESTRRTRSGLYGDTLPLLYEGLLDAEQLIKMANGRAQSAHTPAIIRLAIETWGIEEAAKRLPRMIGIELDPALVAGAPDQARLLALLTLPLLKKGMSEEETDLLLGTEYSQREQVHHDTIARTRIYTDADRSSPSELPVLELIFEEGLLVGWDDTTGETDSRVSALRPRRGADIPRAFGGMYLAPLVLCAIALEERGVPPEDVLAFVQRAKRAIRGRDAAWPATEISTLSNLDQATTHNRIAHEEAASTLEHCLARFTEYESDMAMVSDETFIAAGTRVLGGLGVLEKPVTLKKTIKLVLVAVIIAISLLYIALRTHLMAEDAWPDGVGEETPDQVEAP